MTTQRQPSEADPDQIAEHEHLHPPGEPDEGIRVDDLIDENHPTEPEPHTTPDDVP